ncbi:UDP-N-acetylmuramoyl-L-alanyl-D-glutamate--2,6-diaminopimelate ligase [Ornithinimicrobium sp. Arc0846-15]|nr:UDP-N-acetylmuramoyl-L-alanyl-D-glutamate--2,6-diaminopimelate ligase [Ornithinimicrobium laminariae]
MNLADLIAALPGATTITAHPDTPSGVEVTGVTHQADWVKPGEAFVAIKGARFDGHTFIEKAVESGAVAVIGEGLPADLPCPVPYVQVPVAREALADAAAAVMGYPSRAMQIVGITGTDGKTTTSAIARHVLRAGGLATGLLSTVGYELPDGILRQPPQHFTTPEAPQVQAILAEMADVRAQAAVVETSSHALSMDRVRAVEYDIAVWTNLTSEHLDFHKTMEGYFSAKAALVQRADKAVLNADDEWIDRLVELSDNYVTYSVEGRDADWQASDIVEGPNDLRFTVTSPAGEAQAVLPMIGRFNVANALAALAAADQVGLKLADSIAGLATFPGVAGRMEMVYRTSGQPRVIVDFAHTPPSLEKALDTVRVTTEGDLWVVLGSAGGPRDPSKRAPLGEAATRKADHAVFTEEDHRDTPLVDILEEMERGAREAGRDNFTSIGNRVEAIRYAVASAKPEDTVVLAGKGPEATLERDTETIEWDEMGQAVNALAERG